MTRERQHDWTTDVQFLEGGWVQFTHSPPGWEAFSVSVRADLIDGEPRVTGLRLDPREGVTRRAAALTGTRLRTFPAHAVAPIAYHLAHFTPGRLPLVANVLGNAATEAERPEPTDKRRRTTPEAVATVYAEARRRGKAPRAEVCEVLAISSRTADRYISEARKQGLLAPYVDPEKG